MRRLMQLVGVVASKDVTVLLTGESGTGKDLLARRIHDASPRAARSFVPINCAAIPEPLFESELFGHERGAFTGATERAPGKLEAAHGGTLFLDEVGEMPFAMQAKLLRFLENRRFMRVGGHRKIDVDARVVCATLRPLDAEVEAGRFRGDLFYRLQGIPIEVPPLRERRPDIPALTRHFTAELSRQHGTAPPRWSRAALAALVAHRWPGNVRELRNIVEHVCILRAGKAVRDADLPPSIRAASVRDEPSAELVVSLDRPLSSIVDEVVDRALALEGGSHARAAARLGVSPRTLQRRARRR